MSRPMELEVWGGDWGIPSVDIDCLQILAYAKFSGAPIQTKVTNNPFRRTLPTFRHGLVTCHNLQQVVEHLKTKSINVDLSLTDKQLSEVQAYRQLLKDKLFPGLQFVWWVDNRNYVEFSRPWYAKVLPFPLNYFYPGKYENQAKNYISVLYGCLEDDLTSVETQVYSDSEKCLTHLSYRLGEANYFFGTQPSSFDAVVFSYLAPLLKAPLPNAALQNHLKSCPNLVRFVDRIVSKYFSSHAQEYDKKRQDEAKQQEKETDFPHRRRNQLFAGVIAIAAMAGYGLSTGLLQVTHSDYHDPVYNISDSPDDEGDE